MSSDLQRLRAAAEPFKSFPKAVAVVVRAMFDKGATKVKVIYDFVVTNESVLLRINCDVRWCTREDRIQALEAELDHWPAWALAYVHHAKTYTTSANEFEFNQLSLGEGVNKKQIRTARLLVNELPRLLSPREAFATTVVDETGKTFTLVKGLHETTADGYTISCPERMVSWGTDGLVLKYGAVRVPIGKFLSKVQLSNEEHERLRIFTHPWANGVIEITPTKDGGKTARVPTEASGDFDSTWYEKSEMYYFPGLHGGAAALALVLIAAAVPEEVSQQIGKLVTSTMRDFVGSDHEFVLDDHRYFVKCANSTEVRHLADRVLSRDPFPSSAGVTNLLLDVTHPVFRTVDPINSEVMQVIWWQLAMWIQLNQPEVFKNEPDPQTRCVKIYLALRAQNPQRWDE